MLLKDGDTKFVYKDYFMFSDTLDISDITMTLLVNKSLK